MKTISWNCQKSLSLFPTQKKIISKCRICCFMSSIWFGIFGKVSHNFAFPFPKEAASPCTTQQNLSKMTHLIKIFLKFILRIRFLVYKNQLLKLCLINIIVMNKIVKNLLGGTRRGGLDSITPYTIYVLTHTHTHTHACTRG